jgi:diguanylate cyclase (GGDEF)-like protein/PAS domain S-box-containing protein
MTWRLLAGRAFVERAGWGARADRPALLERSLRAALVESRGRYKDLVELSSDFAFEIDGRGRFAFVSPKGALGYSADDLVGRPVSDLGLDPARAGDLVAAFAPRHGPGQSEVWVRAKSGAPSLLSVTAAPITPAEADCPPSAGTRGIARDITQAHAQAHALTRADLRERLLLRILRAAEDEADPAKAILAVAAAIALATGSACRVFAAGGLVAAAGDGPRSNSVISASVGAPTETDADGGRALMAPARHRGQVLGTLVLWRAVAERPFDADERTLIAALAGHVGLLLAQADAQRELGRLARTDALTGLANRRAFVDETERRLARIRSGQGCAALVLIDLDNFKPINDRLGHGMGDEALVAVARELSGAVRGFDIAARFGGDEFALWLEGADRAVAMTRAEALAAAAPSLVPGAAAAGIPLGMSAGILAVSAGESAALADLMRRADAALYAAKAAGKGCVREAKP